MKNLILTIVLSACIPICTLAAADTLQIKKIRTTEINFKSYAISSDNLFALNDSGRLVIWSLVKLDTVHFANNNSSTKYSAIAKDHEGNIFLGTIKGDVYKIDSKDSSFSLFLHEKYPIENICINASGRMFLISQSAIYDPVSKISWNQFENHAAGIMVTSRKRTFIFFHKKKVLNKFFVLPQYTFLASDDKLWMTASFGEFGGEVEVFDTKSEVIVANKFNGIGPEGIYPKSVFEDDNQNIYITSGLQHFMNFGEIYRIDKNKNVKMIFDGRIKADTNKHAGGFNNDKDFVGPGAYSKTDKHLYFATSSGFYRADINNDKIKPEFLFNASLSWGREPLAIGASMSVKKMEFTEDNKLLFLTQNDGFGLYDGKTITFFK